MMPAPPPIRIGIDLGGTKIAGVALDPSDNVIAETRVKTPRNDYPATLGAIAAVVADLTSRHKAAFSIGVGMPGSIVPNGQTVQNANSTWLNGRSFQADLEDLLGQSVRCANDANCFALSEAHDGAAAGGNPVFGVILGTVARDNQSETPATIRMRRFARVS
jgi:fructokinase